MTLSANHDLRRVFVGLAAVLFPALYVASDFMELQVLALVGGVMFGAAVLRARVYPAWTGIAVIAGLLLSLVLIELELPEAVQTSGTALRSAGFIGMGIALLRRLDTGSA